MSAFVSVSDIAVQLLWICEEKISRLWDFDVDGGVEQK
jgi:hypothetical protein